ncbi:unnamed protein product [Caenorhabditis nigoni]
MGSAIMRFRKIAVSINLNPSSLILSSRFQISEDCPPEDMETNRPMRKEDNSVNHLALIECCILILFELLPPTVQSLVPDPVIYLGAIISACQTLGFVVESILVTVNLEKKYKTTNVVNIGKLMFQSTAGNTSEAQ